MSDKYIGICLYTNKVLSGGEETDDHDAKKNTHITTTGLYKTNSFFFLVKQKR